MEISYSMQEVSPHFPPVVHRYGIFFCKKKYKYFFWRSCANSYCTDWLISSNFNFVVHTCKTQLHPKPISDGHALKLLQKSSSLWRWSSLLSFQAVLRSSMALCPYRGSSSTSYYKPSRSIYLPSNTTHDTVTTRNRSHPEMTILFFFSSFFSFFFLLPKDVLSSLYKHSKLFGEKSWEKWRYQHFKFDLTSFSAKTHCLLSLISISSTGLEKAAPVSFLFFFKFILILILHLVCSLDLTTDAFSWKQAVKAAVLEIRRLGVFGLTDGEVI